MIVVLDDSDFAHSGFYGSTIERSNIDLLASAGLRFTGFSHYRAMLAVARIHTRRTHHHAVGMRAISPTRTSGLPN